MKKAQDTHQNAENVSKGYSQGLYPLTERTTTELNKCAQENYTWMVRLFQGKVFRALKDSDGTPWFVANDVCSHLDYVNTTDAINTHCMFEQRKLPGKTKGGDQMLICISEPDVWNLVFGSKKPQARAFRRWLAEDVLPTLRKGKRFKIDYQPQNSQPEGGPQVNPGQNYDLFPEYVSWSLPKEPVEQLRAVRAKLRDAGTEFPSYKDFLAYVIQKGLEAL